MAHYDSKSDRICVHLKSIVIENFSSDQTFPDCKLRQIGKEDVENFGSAANNFERSGEPVRLKTCIEFELQ